MLVSNPFVNYLWFTRAPGPESGFESGSQSTWERWSESGFESTLPPCKRNQSGSGSGSECPCKRGFSRSHVWYCTCVKPLGQLLHAHAQMMLSQQFFEIHFYLERKLWKKRFLALEWALTWVWCIADRCLCHRANGALAALDFKFGSYTVDCCSECWLQWETVAIMAIWISGENQQTQALQGTLLAN